MSYKWIGSILIIGSCTGYGISLALHQRREVQLLCELRRIIDEMLWELPYQMTPLPELLRHTAEEKNGVLGSLFLAIADELDRQVLPDVLSCVKAEYPARLDSFTHLKTCLLLLGASLGRFNLSGQLKGLSSARVHCQQTIQEMNTNQDVRLRSYRVLGLCAGISLVILLI